MSLKGKQPFQVINIGASFGGINAIKSLLSGLPGDLEAAVCIVQHAPPSGLNLDNVLAGHSPFPLVIAEDGEPLKAGTVYLAAADHHLSFYEDGRLCSSRGPRENGFRPSIDVLLRSAGATFRHRAIGVVLTGLLDDGSVGASDLMACGGRLVVQDPDDAACPDLPANVLQRTRPTRVAPLQDIPSVLVKLCKDAGRKSGDKQLCEAILHEVKISQNQLTGFEANVQEGEPTSISCPECGGPLWQQDDGEQLHYRCHTGHGYTPTALEHEQQIAVEKALYSALRILEERSRMLRTLDKRYSSSPSTRPPRSSFIARAEDAECDAARIRELLHSSRRIEEQASSGT